MARELEEVPEASSVLLLSAHALGYFQRPDVWPFVQQLRCYAMQRGMRFEAKSGPWPVQHETVAVIEVSWNLHQFWATRKPPGDCFFWYFLSKKERKRESSVFFLYFNRGIHTTLSLHTANLGTVVHVIQTLGSFLPTFVYEGEDLSVRNQNLEGLLDDVLAKNQLSRTAELLQWSDLLQLSR